MPPRPRLGSSEPGRSWLLGLCAGPRGDKLRAATGPRRWHLRGSLGPAGWTARDGAREAKATPHPNVLGLRLLAVAHVYLIVCLLRKKSATTWLVLGNMGWWARQMAPAEKRFPEVGLCHLVPGSGAGDGQRGPGQWIALPATQSQRRPLAGPLPHPQPQASPPPSLRSQGTWGHWEPRTGPAGLRTL